MTLSREQLGNLYDLTPDENKQTTIKLPEKYHGGIENSVAATGKCVNCGLELDTGTRCPYDPGVNPGACGYKEPQLSNSGVIWDPEHTSKV
ncbi:MAG: hypothetical protein PHT88_03735 [Candidatus Moranbacteria bacterium]|nr:hypothetical protein [Candidatus Moranbacteria bacterium]